MDFILYLQAMLMGLVEGITEFLPISSTGHLILTAQLLNFWTVDKRELFEIVVQTGAIAAVIYQYWGKLWGALMGALQGNKDAQRLVINLMVASLPAAVIGLKWGGQIKAALFNAPVVAFAFIIGGILILLIERRAPTVTSPTTESMTTKQAIAIGLLQCLAFIPGTSRSGATIISGLMLGVSRQAAAEFSFFLGIPVLMGAGLWDLFKARHSIVAADVPVFVIGLIVAFISALVVIRALIKYVSKHDFTVFAWYRIAFGCIVLLTAYTGLVHW